MAKPTKAWQAAFTLGGPMPPQVKEGISKQDFIKAAQEQIQELLSDNGCNVAEFPSVDGDEHFVAISIEDPKALRALAAKHEVRARVKPEAYKTALVKVPTDRKVINGEDFDFTRLNFEERYLDGLPIDNFGGAFVHYSEDKHAKLEELSEPDKLRVTRRTITQVINMAALEEAEVVTKFFAAHDYKKVQELYARGWSNPLKIQWPSPTMPDFLSRYFGVQVAYFFHFYSTFVRWLLIPAVFGIIVTLLRTSTLLSLEKVHIVNSVFGVGLCLWTTWFLASYKQDMDFKTLRWGMMGANIDVAPVRKSFRDELRGTFKETMRLLFHWLLCALFISETVGVVWFLTSSRSDALASPDGTTLGMPNSYYVLAAKYLITLNIKVVNFAWMAISPMLTERENWRTELDVKSAMTLKLFVVNFVIFYYPFFYTLLIMPTVEGCPEVKGLTEHPLQGCLRMVRADLAVFIVTQVISMVVEVGISIAVMYFRIKREISRKKGGESDGLSYLEVQAFGAPYTVTDEVRDYQDVVFNFGFIAMFGVTSPYICILCFLAAFPLKRLIGYKHCYIHQRVIPRVQEGIGAWSSILNVVAYIGVTVTCYIVVFIYNVGGSSNFRMLLIFVLAERALMLFKFAVESFLSAKSVAHLRIEEYNDDVLDMVLSKDQVVEVPKGRRERYHGGGIDTAP
ncbi:Ano10 [Symbiodinium natans]|uniref:Ano10 protein n=1 Tax=Symbiodinium natans TaxID=878477 RepID=A0A812GT90_9DINO|nr:Ano10 [Symbiodinium natans]